MQNRADCNYHQTIIKQKTSPVGVEVCGGDQCMLGDSITEVKYRRARLVLEWVTTTEDCRAL